MRKLSTLFGALALVATVSLTGCKKKEEKTSSAGSAAALPTEAPAGSAAPAAGSAAAEPAGSAAPTEGSAAAAGSAAAPALTLDIPEGTPKECVEYAETVKKLLACEKIDAEQKETSRKVAQTVLTHQVSPQLTAEAKKGGIQGCVDSTAYIKKQYASDCTF